MATAAQEFNLLAKRCAAALILILSAISLRSEPLDGLGLLFDHFKLTLKPGERTEIAGPVFNMEQSAAEGTWAVPPLVAYSSDSGTDSSELDMLYPILTYDRFGPEYRFQIFQLFSFAGGEKLRDGEMKRRFTLFPIYFQQRSSKPEDNYTALIPIYGHLRNRLFRDEVKFVLMPLYVQSRKKDVVTDNYVYPFFHRRRGQGLAGWQFWPIWGEEHKEPTTVTNTWGEKELVGGHSKQFVLWPFYFDYKLGLGTDDPGTHRAVFPLFSAQRSKMRDSTTYFWPFGYTYTEDREKKYVERGAPWPLIVFARGEGKTVNRVWPFFGQAHNNILQSDFYAWPLYKYNRARAEPLDRERTRILFFLYSDLLEKNTATGTAFHRTDLWPLFTSRRDHNGNERIQLLSILEPLIPGNKSIERSYSPVWSIWRTEKNAKTQARSDSFLWNLYRQESSPSHKKCSLLFGLFQYEKTAETKRCRIFFIPFGSHGPKKTPERAQNIAPEPSH